MPGVTPGKWSARWRNRHPDLPLELSEYDVGSQLTVLHDGRADLIFVRLPLEQEGLNVIPLYDEQPVVVASKEHFVALYDGEVPLADLEDENFLRVEDCGSEAVAVEIAAAGVGIVVLPMSVARLYRRRDAVYRPISDTPETRIGLAWCAEKSSELIDEFIGIVRGRTANSSRSPVASEGSQKAGGKDRSAKRAESAKVRHPRRGGAHKVRRRGRQG